MFFAPFDDNKIDAASLGICAEIKNEVQYYDTRLYTKDVHSYTNEHTHAKQTKMHLNSANTEKLHEDTQTSTSPYIATPMSSPTKAQNAVDMVAGTNLGGFCY